MILSQEQKQLIFSTVSNFEAYKRCRRKIGLDDTITYGVGMVLLFYGAPGTGKTMMANALANKLKKKVKKILHCYMYVRLAGVLQLVNVCKLCGQTCVCACDVHTCTCMCGRAVWPTG